MAFLFHYTSAAGLKGIVDSQNFWATHYKFLNDYREGSVLTSAITELFHRRLEEYLERSISDARKEEIRQQHGSLRRLAESDAQTFASGVFGAHEKFMPSYVTSFCEHSEPREQRNGLLSQWRSYASGGGYCLILDKDRLEQIIGNEAASSKSAQLVSGAVDYIGSPDDADLKNFDKAFQKIIPSLAQDQDSRENMFNHLYEPMLTVVPFAKDEHFSEESEYRIVVASLDREVVGDKFPCRSVKFRESANCLIPYVDVFEKEVELPLVGVVVGPGGNVERRRLGVERYLREKKLDIEVRLSEIPYLG